MKRIILAALVGVLVVGFLAITAIAQGTLLFECDTKQGHRKSLEGRGYEETIIIIIDPRRDTVQYGVSGPVYLLINFEKNEIIWVQVWKTGKYIMSINRYTGVMSSQYFNEKGEYENMSHYLEGQCRRVKKQF